MILFDAMKFSTPQSLQSLADLIGARVLGDPNHPVTGINEIHRVEPGDLVFCDHPKYYDKALDSAAGTVLMNAEADVPAGKGILVSEDPFKDFNALTRHFMPTVHPASAVDQSASVGEGTHIAPNVVVGAHVQIGRDCVIQSGVVIHQNAIIGDRVTIHANTVIGADAFYFQKRENGYNKMHTCGSVVVEDDVEIGALCTIDRGVSADTRIGQGSKLDNQVHIGHDTVVGKHCLFAAQVGIAGCVVVEDHVTLWGQVGVASDLVIGHGAVVLGQSGITKSVAAGKTYFGSPAQEASKKYREMASLRQLLRQR